MDIWELYGVLVVNNFVNGFADAKEAFSTAFSSLSHALPSASSTRVALTCK